jgi:alkyldihydroxyacetonephosphate synthase
MTRVRAGEEIARWAAAKGAASEAIVAAGGTITHHHAVGRDHAPYLGAEVGDVGLAALRALKRELDPAGVMNPGKLLPLE